MKRYKIILCIVQLLLFTHAKSQDTLKVKGVVLSIDTIRYYNVIKIKTLDSLGSNMVVLSLRDSLKDVVKNKFKETIVGNCYTFKVVGISIIKGEDGDNIFLNLRKFIYGSAFSLDNGEVPYLALNMSNLRIWDSPSDCKKPCLLVKQN